MLKSKIIGDDEGVCEGTGGHLSTLPLQMHFIGSFLLFQYRHRFPQLRPLSGESIPLQPKYIDLGTAEDRQTGTL